MIKVNYLRKPKINKEELIRFVKERYIYILAYLYLSSSVFIFLLGNVKYAISVPLTIILTIAVVKAILNAPKMEVSLFSNKKKSMITLILISFWVTIGGVGGFIWQNSDHIFRNALFKDLVSHNWPVLQDGTALCYYIGFWLPSAIIGKLFGLTAGFFFQTIWAILGISIAYGMICQYLKKTKIRNLIIFIFFSGLDVCLYLLLSKIPLKECLYNITQGIHMENATTCFQSSSNTTLLFWVYNQIIPFWVGMMLLLQQKNSKSIIFIYSLMLLYSPFPLVALAPIIVYLIFKKRNNNKNEERKIKNIFLKIKYACTYENIVALLIMVIIALFYKSNIAAGKIGMISMNSKNILEYVLYILSEYIVFLIFIYKDNYKNTILNILIVTTFILPFIRLGNGKDFAMRTCIPLAFYIMLLVMKYLQQNNVNKKLKIALIIILCIGAVTPITELIRTAKGEMNVIKGTEVARNNVLSTVFDKKKNQCYDNFNADIHSIFYQYLAK